jgi:hypothetical protein
MSLAGTLEAKARYSVKLLYEWANGAPQTGSTGPIEEAPPPAPDTAPAQLGEQSKNLLGSFQMAENTQSQNTLRLDDIIPEWRDPLSVRRG